MEDYPQHKDEKKPLWQEWPDRPVPLRTTQLLTRAVGCLFELAVVVYYLWFSARCPDRFSQAATGFSAVLVGLFMDAYEAYMMASRERDFPVNPCAICVDFLVLIVGFVGLWLLVFSDRTTELQLLQPPNDAQSVAGGLLVATLAVHGLFLLLGVVGLCISSSSGLAGGKARSRRRGSAKAEATQVDTMHV